MRDEDMLKWGLGIGVTLILGYYLWPKLASAKSLPSKPPETIDLSRVEGVQRGLYILGFNPGIIDGKFGTKTKSAVANYQRSRNLTADSAFGPNTRHKMDYDLKSRGINVTGNPGPTFK